MFDYWFMFPVAVVVATLATGSGFGGGIIFFPVFVHGLHLSIPEAIGTGMVTELCGMTSAMITYSRQRQVEFEVALPMILLSFPGLLIGLYAVQTANPNWLKVFFGVIVLLCAFWLLFSLKESVVNTNANILIEEMIPYSWVPFLGGISSGISSVGTAESILPVLDRILKIEIHRAVATAVVVEGAVGWLATALNIQEGHIRWDIALFTMSGVIIGGRLGPFISSFITDKTLKLAFSFFVIPAGCQMIYIGLSAVFG